MPEKPGRSVFVPLLIIVTVLIGTGVVLTLVPLVECELCNKEGYFPCFFLGPDTDLTIITRCRKRMAKQVSAISIPRWDPSRQKPSSS